MSIVRTPVRPVGEADRSGAPGQDLTPREPTFGELFEREHAALYRYLARRVPAHVAEDLTSETFTRALEGWSRLDLGRGSPRAWLYGIATNVLSGHRREERRAFLAFARTGLDPLVLGADESEAVDRRVDARAHHRALADALALLHPRDRDVLLLVAHADLTYAEVSQALGIPLGTVRSRLHRARLVVTRALDRTEAP